MVANNVINAPKPFSVTIGGTGVATMTTAYAPVCAGTTATGPLQTTPIGTAGQLLRSSGAGVLPGWASGISIDSTGRMTNTTQPAFAAVLSSNALNVTGDGTVYNVVFDTATFNQGSYYNTTTGIFTAPVTGNYAFFVEIRFSQLTSSHVSATVGDSGGSAGSLSHIQAEYNPWAVQVGGANSCQIPSHTVRPLIAGDTMFISVKVEGGTKVVDLVTNSIFSGYLIC